MLKLLLAHAVGTPLLAADLAPTGRLRAAFIRTNPVQGRVDAKTGVINGPVEDLARELARRRGVPYTVIPLSDASVVIEHVRGGQADIGFLAVEAARATQVDFSEPYLMAGSAYVVRAGSDIMGSGDVDRAGVKVGVAKGVAQQIFFSGNLKNAQVIVLPDVPPHDVLVSMMARGELDAFAANRQRMEEAGRTSSLVRVLADDFLRVGQAIVVPKGDASRLAEVQKFLADIRATDFVKASIDQAGLTRVATAR